MTNTKVLEMHDHVIIPKVYVASGFFTRFLGLMGRKEIPPDEAVLFPKCNSIHTFFMRFAIDVVLVGSDGHVTEVREAMMPWQMMLPRREAKHIIEMKAGVAKKLGITVGAKLRCNGVLT
jgi:uncharacterized protein